MSVDPSNKFGYSLIQIDKILEDLSFANDISPQNYTLLTQLTTRLRDFSLTSAKQTEIIDSLKQNVFSALSRSSVPDTLLSIGETLRKKFPKELHNAFFEFHDLTSFKYLAMEDTKTALLLIQNQDETDKILKALHLRMLHHQLFYLCLNLPTLLFSLLNQLGKEKSHEVTIEKLQIENQNLKEENHKLKSDLKFQKSERSKEIEISKIMRIQAQDYEKEAIQRERVLRLELNRKDEEIRQLRRNLEEAEEYRRDCIRLRGEINRVQDEMFKISSENEALVNYSEQLKAKLEESSYEYYSEDE